MKGRIIICAAGAFGLMCLAAPRAKAYHEISASFEITADADFYEPLAAHGTWIEVGGYGRCWRPASVAIGWRPYCYGHWESTDCGWFWVSDEPWGWACYHYGRWYYDPVYAWVWVPGVDWAPAWVSWRYGGGYVGWAPLPPTVSFSGGVIVGAHVDVAPSYYVFVPETRIYAPVRPRTVIINNTTIINKTVNITKVTQVEKNITNVGQRKVIVNEGPQLPAMQKVAANRIRPVPIQQVAQRAAPPASLRRTKAPAQEKRGQRPLSTQEQPRQLQESPRHENVERPRMERELEQQTERPAQRPAQRQREIERPVESPAPPVVKPERQPHREPPGIGGQQPRPAPPPSDEKVKRPAEKPPGEQAPKEKPDKHRKDEGEETGEGDEPPGGGRGKGN